MSEKTPIIVSELAPELELSTVIAADAGEKKRKTKDKVREIRCILKFRIVPDIKTNLLKKWKMENGK